MKKRIRKYDCGIIATFFVLMAIGLVIGVTTAMVYREERKSSFETLHWYTEQFANDIRNYFDEDVEYLNMIENLLSTYDTAELGDVLELVNGSYSAGLISEFEILTPGDKVLFADGSIMDVSGRLSFEEESSKGQYISSREKSIRDENIWVIRHCIPIEKNGEIMGVLCGIIDLSQIEDILKFTYNKDDIQVYMADGISGDMLIDTWHDTLGNIEILKSRTIKKGYSYEKLHSDFINGQAGEFVFFSKTVKEDFYSCYEPLGINGWMIMVTFPESQIFGKMNNMMFRVYFLVGIMTLIGISYFVWMIKEAEADRVKKENELGKVRYVLEISKLLLDTHLKPEHMYEALKKIINKLTAEKAFLFVLQDTVVKQEYACDENGQIEGSFVGVDFAEGFYDLRELLKGGKSKLVYDMERTRKVRPKAVMDKAKDIKNLILTPIEDLEGKLTGVLGVVNTSYHWENAALLECLSVSFSAAINNIHTHKTMHQMGMIDALTGLHNRNCYHMDLMTMEDYGKKMDSLACVYMDANGLHEINNHLGHEAGDKMLMTIAEELKLAFGMKNSYRIGGDEFVVLCCNMEEKQIEERIQKVDENLQNAEYYISFGIEWSDTQGDWTMIVRSAEEKMQQAKREFYRRKGDMHKLREMNRQLEQILTRKKDADTFLDVIASKFKGVYFVNMSNDSYRSIYIPEYFENMLIKSKDKFSLAMGAYANEKVSEEDRDRFQEFCQFEYIDRELDCDKVAEIVYPKIDQELIQLKVFKSMEYTKDNKETLWIFENISK